MIKPILILFIFFILIRWGGSQSRPNIATHSESGDEIELSEIDSQIQKLQREQNILQNQLTIRLAKTDSLKAAGASENTLAHFTAASFILSQKLETKRSQLKELDKQRQKKRIRLYRSYSHQIDSLSGLPGSAQHEQKIFDLMSKRLLVSPPASRLHFNPQQLSAISETGNDSLAQVIFKEYLKKAARELNREIIILHKKEQEIGEIAALESKAEEFMQEMEESALLPNPSGSGTKTQEVLGTDYSGNNIGTRNLITANEQALGFFRIRDQIQNSPNPLSSGQPLLSYAQLLEQFSETRRLLESYRQQVLKKLKRLTDK